MLPIQWIGGPVDVQAKPIRPIGRQGTVNKSHHRRDSYCAFSESGFAARSLMLRLMAGIKENHAMKYPTRIGKKANPRSTLSKPHCLYTRE